METEPKRATRRTAGRTGHRSAGKARANEPQTAAPDSEAPDAESQHRWQMIEVRAYLLAESRGFEPGRELEDWLQAEQEVDAQLGGATDAPRISE